MKKKLKKKNNSMRISADLAKPSQPATPAKKGWFLNSVAEYGILLLLGVSPLIFLRMGGEFENNPKMAFLQWGIAILSIVQLLRIKAGSVFNWKRTPLDFPIILFYLFCLLSLFQAVNPYQAVLSLLQWGAAIIFYFFILHVIKTEKTIPIIFFMASLSICFVSVIGILQQLVGIAWIPQLTMPASTFSNKNMASQFVAIAIPLVIGSVFISRQLWMKAVSFACLPIAGTYLLYTETRSAWLSVSVMLSLLIAASFFPPFSMRIKHFLSGKRLIYAVFSVVFICGLLWFTPARQAVLKAPDRFASIGVLEGTSKLRTIWWMNTLEMVKDNLWLGVGLGNFKLNYPPYHRATERDWSFSESKQVNRVHNDHLQMLVELGFFGFIMYAGMFLTFFYLFWKIYFRQKNNSRKLPALFIFLSVVSFVIIAFLTFPMERAIPPIYLFTCFALMAFLYAKDYPKNIRTENFKLQAGLRIIMSLLLVLFLCTSFFFIRKIVLSDKYFVEALTVGEQGNLKQANKLLEKAKIFSMWNFNIPGLLARNYTIAGNYDAAIEEYREAFRAHPYNTNAMLNTGYCYLQLKNYDRAEEYFKKFLEIIPDSPKGYNNLGIVCYSKKQLENAEKNYKKAFELDSGYAEPHFNLGNMYRVQGRIEESLKEYELALKLSPGMDDARRFLSSLYMETGNYTKAGNILTPLLKEKGKAAEGYILQGNIKQKQGRHREAVNLFLNALKLSPKNAFIYYNIGLSYYYLHDYPKSEKSLNIAVSLNPGIIDSYNLLGQLYLRKKDDPGALKFFQKALKINPNLRDAQFNVGTIFLRLEKYDQAIIAYKKTLDIDPVFSLAHYNLATIFRHKGRKKEALFHFKKALVNPSDLIDIKQAKGFIAELKTDKK